MATKWKQVMDLMKGKDQSSIQPAEDTRGAERYSSYRAPRTGNPSKIMSVLGVGMPTLPMFPSEPGTQRMTYIILTSMMLSLVIFMIWFAVSPDSFSNSNPFEKPSTSLDAFNGFYYWGTLTSTVGFGDICPKTVAAKLMTIIYQVIITLASLGILWKVTDKHFKVLEKTIRQRSGSTGSE